MIFTNENNILLNFQRKDKCYTARQLLNKFLLQAVVSFITRSTAASTKVTGVTGRSIPRHQTIPEVKAT